MFLAVSCRKKNYFDMSTMVGIILLIFYFCNRYICQLQSAKRKKLQGGYNFIARGFNTSIFHRRK